jgi:hypothetical protein
MSPFLHLPVHRDTKKHTEKPYHTGYKAVLYCLCLFNCRLSSTALVGQEKGLPAQGIPASTELALEQILEVLKESPTKAMEIKVTILLVSLRAKNLCKQCTIIILLFAKNDPIWKAIHQEKQVCISMQLGQLVERVQGQGNVDKISILLAEPWSKPAFAYATFRKAKKEIMPSWKQSWKHTREKEKSKAYAKAIQHQPRCQHGTSVHKVHVNCISHVILSHLLTHLGCVYNCSL